MYRSIGLSFLNLIPLPSRLSIGGRYPAHIYVSIYLYSLDAALLGDSFRHYDCYSLVSDCMHRFSVLPAISYNNSIIHCEIVEGSFCTESFQSFVRRLLNQMQPFPAPNSVIVM